MKISSMKEVIEEMRVIYPFKDEDAEIKIEEDMRTRTNRVVRVTTHTDNDIVITMSKTIAPQEIDKRRM